MKCDALHAHRIKMYYLDTRQHHLPHIHVRYQEQEVVLSIADIDYSLILTFANGEVRAFDVKPYLDIGIFRELRDQRLFNSVRPFLGSVQWQHGQDFCPDTLYLESVPVPAAQPVVI